MDAATNETAARLRAYRALVERYHGTLDLVSKRGLAEFDRYLDEGLRYARLVERLVGPAACVVDVGSGAGLPGVVVAIALPGATVHLVERRRRRAAFLQLVVGQLGLANARVFEGDVRALTGVSADVVTAQAVASLAEVARLTAGVRGEACWLVSRRGPDWRAELEDVREATGGAGTEAGSAWADADVVEEALEPHGSLVAIRLPGGLACRSSA